jgi:hypothetical protein
VVEVGVRVDEVGDLLVGHRADGGLELVAQGGWRVDHHHAVLGDDEDGLDEAGDDHVAVVACALQPVAIGAFGFREGLCRKRDELGGHALPPWLAVDVSGIAGRTEGSEKSSV